MIGSVEKSVLFAYNLCYDNNNYVSSNLLSKRKNPIIWLKQAKHLLVQKKMPMLYVYMHTQHFYLFNPIAQTKRGLRRRNDDIYKQWGNELTLRFLRRPAQDDPSKRYYCDINPNIYMNTNLILS